MGKKIYRLRNYDTTYHIEASTQDDAKETLKRQLDSQYNSPVPLSHIKVLKVFK